MCPAVAMPPAHGKGFDSAVREIVLQTARRQSALRASASVESEVDALEDAIFSRTSDRPNVERIYEIRHELLLLRRAVQPLQEMCNRMMRFDVPLIDQAMHPYFRDIQDHVIRLVESIDNLRDLL